MMAAALTESGPHALQYKKCARDHSVIAYACKTLRKSVHTRSGGGFVLILTQIGTDGWRRIVAPACVPPAFLRTEPEGVGGVHDMMRSEYSFLEEIR